MLLLLAWRLAGPIALALPRHLAYALSGLLMDLVWHGWPQGRRAMRANLRVLLATDDAAQIDYWSQRQLRRYGEFLVDTARLPALQAAHAPDLLISEQWPELDAVMRPAPEGSGQETRPVIFALTHFGNWDVAGAALTGWSQRHGTPPLHVLAESLGNDALDDMMQRQRERLGVVSIPLEGGPLRAMRALRSGAPLAILFDRPLGPEQSGLDVTLGAAQARLPDGLARLALATNAKVVPFGNARLPGRDFRFRPLVDFDFEYEQTGDRALDAERLMQQIVDVHAGWFRRYPDQWYQFRLFFATRAALGASAGARTEWAGHGQAAGPATAESIEAGAAG